MNIGSLPLTWQSTCATYTVSISRRALKNMLRLAQAHSPNEVGTSLVGTYSEDGTVATILGLAPVTSDSRGFRFSFIRGIAGLGDFFSYVFKRFRGQRHYVGEWHSHPSASPAPSFVDNENQTRIANDAATECPEAILVILGGNFVSKPELAVYVYSRTRGKAALIPK